MPLSASDAAATKRTAWPARTVVTALATLTEGGTSSPKSPPMPIETPPPQPPSSAAATRLEAKPTRMPRCYADGGARGVTAASAHMSPHHQRPPVSASDEADSNPMPDLDDDALMSAYAAGD